MVSDEMAARAGNQRDQLLDQFVRREHDMRGPISPGLLEAQGKPTVGQFLQTIVRDRRPCQVATKVFEAIAIVGAHAHIRVHIETGDLCASLAYDRGLGILAGTSQAQYAADGDWRLEAGGWRSRPNTRDHQSQARWFNVAVIAIERSAPWRFRRPFLTAHDRHRRKGSQDDPQARVGTRPRVRNRAQCRETASSQPRSAERILLRCSTPWKLPLAGLATSIRISLRAEMSDYVGRPPRQGCRPTRTPEACCDRAFPISSSPYSHQPAASSLSARNVDQCSCIVL